MQLLLGGWLLGSLALGTYGLMMLDFHEDIKKADQMVMEDTPRASYNGIRFDSKEHMKIYFKMARMDEGHLFKWISVLPEFLILMISACSFGLLGSASMVIREVVMGKGQLLWKNAVWIPVLGAVVGVVIVRPPILEIIIPGTIPAKYAGPPSETQLGISPMREVVCSCPNISCEYTGYVY